MDQTCIDEFASAGYDVRRCFPDSFKELWAFEQSGDEPTEADVLAWSEYNIALKIGVPEGFSVIIFPSEMAWQDAISNKQFPVMPSVRNPDGTVSSWFISTSSYGNFYSKQLDARIVSRNYLVPAPPSRVGTAECSYINIVGPPKTLPVWTPPIADATPLHGRQSFAMSAIPLRGMMAFAPEENQYFIGGGLLDSRGKMMIAGVPKAGKSRLALNLAFSLATGRPFLGFPTMHFPRVLFVQFEVSEFRFRLRVNSIARHWNIPPDNNIPIYSLTLPSLRLDARGGTDELRRLVRAVEAEVVFLDPMVKIHTGQESEQSEMQQLLNTIDDLIDELGISVVLVHHMNKNSEAESWARIRGSSYIPAWADSLLLIGKDTREAKPSVAGILRNGEDFMRYISFKEDHTVEVIGTIQDAMRTTILELMWEPGITGKVIQTKVAKMYNLDIAEVAATIKVMRGEGHNIPA